MEQHSKDNCYCEVNEQTYFDLMDTLLNPDNNDPIVFEDGNGKKFTFAQVAIIPYELSDGEKHLYAVLKPMDKIEGVADDMVMVFEIVEEQGIQLVVDEEIAKGVYDKLIELANESLNK